VRSSLHDDEGHGNSFLKSLFEGDFAEVFGGSLSESQSSGNGRLSSQLSDRLFGKALLTPKAFANSSPGHGFAAKTTRRPNRNAALPQHIAVSLWLTVFRPLTL